MRNVAVRGLVWAMLFAVPSAAAAQEVSTCGWDFLAEIKRPPSVDQLLSRSGANSELVRVIAQLDKWYSECDETSAREAVLQLRRLASRQGPVATPAKALLGVALARGPEVQVVRAPGVWLRATHKLSNAESEAVRLLASVFSQEAWPEVGQELAALAVATARPESLRAANEAFRAGYARESSLNIPFAEVLLAQGSTREAREVAASHITPRSKRVAALAAIADGISVSSASKEYLEALDSAREAAAVQYFFDDIRLILEADELREWDSLRSGHAQWIRRKWEWRAFLAGVSPQERVATHGRRMAAALSQFRRESHRGAPPSSVLTLDVSREHAPLDDRGLVFLRHGEADTILRSRSTQRIAWVYGSPTGHLVFEFGRTSSRSDFYLLEPHPICGGNHVLTGQAARGYPPLPDRLGWSMTLAPFDRSLSDYYSRCESGSDFAAIHYTGAREGAIESAFVGLSTETAMPKFAEPVAIAANLYSFPMTDSTELVAYLALPVRALKAASEQPLIYAVDVRIGAGRPGAEQIVLRDSTVRFTVPQQIVSEATVALSLSLHVPWTTDTRVAITLHNTATPAEGQFVTTRKRIGFASTDEIKTSDIVIAETREGRWSRGDVALAPFLGHAVPRATPIRMYYELHGIARGDRVLTEIMIAPTREVGGLLESLISAKRAAAIRFEEEPDVGNDGIVRSERDIHPELEPGTYVVSIISTNSRTGARTSANTNLTVF